MTDTTIQPVTTKQWVEALRSGEYEQVTGTLAESEGYGQVGYCCLGVLSKLAGYPTVKHPYGVGGEFHIDGFDYGEHGRNGGVIPDGLMSTIVSDLDLNKTTAVPDSPNVTATCDLMRVVSSMNDKGYSFNKIADFLEKQVDA